VFEAAARKGSLIECQGGEVLIQLIIGDLFGKTVKVQADESDPADVIVKSTLALAPEDNLLLKCFKNSLKATNR